MRPSTFIKIISFACLCTLSLTGCENHNSVNVMVTNKQETTISNVPVKVSMKEVCTLLHISSLPSPFVLNEKNMPVRYQYNARHDSILFIMPIIHKHSQKTFSINIEKPTLSKNFMRLRRANILIEK
jgi:uncharacterized protein YcfL